MKRSPLRRKSWLRRRARLRQFSPAGKIKSVIYTKQRAEFLAEHPWCEFRRKADGTPAHRLDISARRCKRRSTQVHHRRFRGRWHNDKRFFFPSCAVDHDWINKNGKEAERLGYIERIYLVPMDLSKYESGMMVAALSHNQLYACLVATFVIGLITLVGLVLAFVIEVRRDRQESDLERQRELQDWDAF